MKTYWRLLSFAKPLNQYLPLYLVLAIVSIVFGLLNFTLLIPLLDILFKKSEQVSTIVLQDPGALNTQNFKAYFNYQFIELVENNGPKKALAIICGVIIVSVFLSNLFRFLSMRVLTNLRTTIVKRMRESMFKKINELHVGFFNDSKKGDLMSALSNDINEVEHSIVNTIQIFLKDPLVLLLYLVALFLMSVKLTLFVLLVFPISGLVISSITRKLRKDAKKSQQMQGDILSIIEETISGTRIIKAFTAENFVFKRFDKENWGFRNLLKSMYNKREMASPISEFLGIATVALVIYFGGSLVIDQSSELSGSAFIAYIILFSQLLVPAKGLASATTNLQRGMASGERIFKLLDEPVLISEPVNAKSLSEFQQDITLKNISFAYGDKVVINNLSHTFEKGKIYALVGQSGAGKSTLLDLIPRFIDPAAGEILLDNIPLNQIKLYDLRKQMGLVTQETILFNDTVFNNIAFGIENASEADVIRAAKIANAHSFITALENGYQTNIGDRGNKLSGGQRQRISIARAVLKNPPILLLDEATSALDTESERLVQDALNNLMQNRTTIVIAHRLSTIQHADEILLMHAGEIVEKGTHQSLLAQNGRYRKLIEMQQL